MEENMKKTMIAGVLMLNACAYNPVIDTAGRSGTYNSDQARLITNDVNHCKIVADKNTNKAVDTLLQASNWYWSTATLGIIPKREMEYKKIVKQCLKGRGHSVIK